MHFLLVYVLFFFQAVEWPLLYPEIQRRMGLSPTKGILLYGPPGCCKTTLVRAAATSCNVTFLTLNTSQIYSQYLGESQKIISEVRRKSLISYSVWESVRFRFIAYHSLISEGGINWLSVWRVLIVFQLIQIPWKMKTHFVVFISSFVISVQLLTLDLALPSDWDAAQNIVTHKTVVPQEKVWTTTPLNTSTTWQITWCTHFKTTNMAAW